MLHSAHLWYAPKFNIPIIYYPVAKTLWMVAVKLASGLFSLGANFPNFMNGLTT